MPDGGAGSLDSLIRLYIGWGRNFVVLLDSDGAGLKEKKRYEELFGGLVNERIFALKDIEATWTKSRMEDLIEDDDKLSISARRLSERTKV